MSLAAVAYNSNPNSVNLSHRSIRRRNGVLFMAIPTRRSINSRPPSLPELVFRIPHLSLKRSRNPISPRVKFVSPVMEWQNCTAKMEVDIPASVAYKCYSDREAIPQWMPFISSVKVLEDNPSLSRWSLKYKAFGQDIQFSWLARNLQPIPNQKIHWRSLEGLPNRGVVRFYPKGPSSCLVESTFSLKLTEKLIYVRSNICPRVKSLIRATLRSPLVLTKKFDLALNLLSGKLGVRNFEHLTVSYEVPPFLSPVASALQPLLERLLGRGLESFATFAKKYQTA